MPRRVRKSVEEQILDINQKIQELQEKKKAVTGGKRTARDPVAFWKRQGRAGLTLAKFEGVYPRFCVNFKHGW